MKPRRSLFLVVIFLVIFQLPLSGQQCGGTERWPVKVGSDSGAIQVDLSHPTAISLHDLVNVQRPQIPSDDTTRVAEETRVYTVVARLLKFKPESGKDGDQDFGTREK